MDILGNVKVCTLISVLGSLLGKMPDSVTKATDKQSK